jgi:hypothetical protein
MPPRLVLLLLTLGATLALRGDARPLPPSPLRGAPPTILWAWEEPEDLRTLDPRQAGVAFLADRVFLDQELHVIPRRQQLLLAPATWTEAVVRIEATPRFGATDALRNATVAQLLRTAALPGIRGLQIDFDATQSQRPFYAAVLRQLRGELPPGFPLTITALLSWCSVQNGWLANLPIDQAVPMNFRLGEHAGRWPVVEPRCRSALGLSTDEPELAPAAPPPANLYLFAPRPWTAAQLAQINHAQIPAQLPTSPKGLR